MKTTITKCGQTVVPIPQNPIKEFRGLFKGSGLTESLLKERARERGSTRRQKKP